MMQIGWEPRSALVYNNAYVRNLSNPFIPLGKVLKDNQSVIITVGDLFN